MAERNHLRIANHNDVSNDDPFAELTRIMGFDPRKPVRNEPAEPVEAAFEEDDFGIDLEKELMGEFSAAEVEAEHHDERTPDHQAEAHTVHAPAESVEEFDDAVMVSFEEEFALVGDETFAAEESAEVAQPLHESAEDDFGVALEEELAAQDDFQVETPAQAVAEPVEEFDDAVAASLEEELALVGEETFAAVEETAEPAEIAQFHSDPDLGDDFSVALEEELAAQDDFQAATDPAEAISVVSDVASAPSDAIEDAVAASFEQEFTLEDQIPAASDVEETPLVASNFDAPAGDFDHVVEASAEDEQSLDEGLPVIASAEAEAAEETAPISDSAFEDFATSMEQDLSLEDDWRSDQDELVAAVDEAPAYQPAQALAETDDETAFASDFDAALADVDMDFASHAVDTDEPVEATADDVLDAELAFRLRKDMAEDVAPTADSAQPAVTEAAADPVDEFSLEDELNALLGNLPARAPAVEPVAAVSETLQSAEVADDAEIAGPVDEVESVNWGPADEQAAVDMTRDAFAEAPAESEPVSAVYVDAGEEHVDGEDETSVALAAEDAGDDTNALHSASELDADLDLDFDDAAFEAAMSNSIASEEPVLHQAEQDSVPQALPEQEQSVARQENDPYAALSPLAASFRSDLPETAAPVQEAQFDDYDDEPAHGAYDDEEADGYVASSGYDDIPDIETVDVPEHALALADDLDIPEFAYEEDVPAAPAYDDIDAEFNSLLNEMNSPEPVAAAPAPSYDSDAYEAEFEREFNRQSGPGAASDYAYPAAAAGVLAGAAYAGTTNAAQMSDARRGDNSADRAQAGAEQDEFEVDQFDFDAELDEEMAPSAYGANIVRERPQRRGMMIAAIVGGVAIIGGIGAFAMSFGDGAGSGAPALVKADGGPIKVKPENPGGTTVPNQDNKVYDSVAGTGGGADPKQEKLLTSAEEPVEIPAPEARIADDEAAVEPDAPQSAAKGELAGSAPAPAGVLPGVETVGKSEDRIEQVIDEAGIDNSVEVAAVAPRKVRTMIVKPDGTLVAREDPAPAAVEAPAAAPVTTASAGVKEPVASTPESTGTVPTEPGATFTAPAGGDPAAQEAAAPTAPAPANAAQSTPTSMPIAPARPSDQPVDIVGEVKSDQVAAISPTAAAGAWSMQIASQPSEAAAQSSYQDLLRRYGSVLEGRQANIVKAEVAGKGTFWRVRVPAGSRNDAVSLCESYKSAGGNCFVSK